MRRTLLLAVAAAPAAHAQTIDAPNVSRTTLEPAVVEAVAGALPESRNVDRAFLDPAYDPSLRLTERAQIFVSFVDEGAGYQNSLGYFAWREGALDGLTKKDVDTDSNGIVSLAEAEAVGIQTGWVFPDATRAPGRLAPGDTVSLGNGTVFEADTRVGFFLVQNGWDGTGVRGVTSPGNPQVFYTLDFLNPEGAAGGTVADSGIGVTRHVAMLFEDPSREQIIMGFEDLNRSNRLANVSGFASDEDFNDAVFLIRSNPVEAIRATEIATAPGPLAGSTFAGLAILGLAWLRRRERRP
jgi:hypothetical protein